MEVIVKKQLFMPLLMGLGLLGSTNLNAMRLQDILNHDGAGAAAEPAVGCARLGQAPIGDAPRAGQAPEDRKAFTTVLKKLFTAPWTLGSSITSAIDSATTNVESSTKVFTRCFVEGVLCGIALYLASGSAVSDVANRRLQLADFALDDVFSVTPFHYTCSRLWIAISGLQYCIEFLGLSGLRLYAWGFGMIIGLRCAYDSFIRLPISLVSGRHENTRRYPWGLGGLND